MFVLIDGLSDPRNGVVHTVHQHWIVQVLKLGAEEKLCLIERPDASLNQQVGQHGRQIVEFRTKTLNESLIVWIR